MTTKNRKWRSLFALCACVMLLLSACQSAQDKAYDDMVSAMKADASSAASLPSEVEDHQNYISYPELSPDQVKEVEPIEGDTLQGHLTIMRHYESIYKPTFMIMAEEFMTLHPGVTIELAYDFSALETGALPNYIVDEMEEDWASRLRVELAAGEGDFILYDPPQALNIPGLLKSGILVDLYEYWKNDPEIQHEDYFEQVLEACSVDGKLAAIPFAFEYNEIYLNKAMLEKIGVDPASISTVSTTDVLDWYEQAREFDPELQLIFTSQSKDRLFAYETSAYMDLENHTATFDSPEFIDFLARTRAAKNDDPLLLPNVNNRSDRRWGENVLYYHDTGERPIWLGPEGWDRTDENAVLEANVSFAVPYWSEIPEFYVMQQQPLTYLAGPYPFTNSKGQLGLSTYQEFVVPSSCQNKELAWEFIKYCVQERPSNYLERGMSTPTALYTNGIALNKNLFRKGAVDMRNQMGLFNYPTDDRPEPLDEELCMEQAEQALSMDMFNMKEYYLDVQDYLDEFYVNELTTPEQAAEKIQGRAYIWLNE